MRGDLTTGFENLLEHAASTFGWDWTLFSLVVVARDRGDEAVAEKLQGVVMAINDSDQGPDDWSVWLGLMHALNTLVSRLGWPRVLSHAAVAASSAEHAKACIGLLMIRGQLWPEPPLSQQGETGSPSCLPWETRLDTLNVGPHRAVTTKLAGTARP